MELEIIKDNTQKVIPEQPVVTYELVADMGKGGTKTVYECESLQEIYSLINRIRENDLDIPHLDLYEDELDDLKGLSINIKLTASNLDITVYGSEHSATAELVSYKIKEKKNMKFYLIDSDNTLFVLDIVNETYKRSYGFYCSEKEVEIMKNKVRAIQDNIEALKDQAILEGMRSKATVDGKPMKDQYIKDALKLTEATTILLDVDNAYDEFYLCYNVDRNTPKFLPNSCCHIEVVTKKVAEENDREFLSSDDSFTKEDLKNYKVGEVLSDYRKLGNSEYYFKFM